jgi:hypothetical protein
MSRPQEKTTPPLVLAAAWIVVATPLAWGVYQTAVKSIPLFQVSAAAEAATTSGRMPAPGSATH